MNPKCSHCGESLTREPGFYIGAMYVSYALSVGLTVAVYLGLVVALDIPTNFALGLLIFLFIILVPISFRLARLIWINIFVKYKKEKSN